MLAVLKDRVHCATVLRRTPTSKIQQADAVYESIQMADPGLDWSRLKVVPRGPRLHRTKPKTFGGLPGK